MFSALCRAISRSVFNELECSMKYEVIDRRTGKVVGSYTNKTRARSRRDALDMQYGAVRYMVREVAA